MYVYTSLSLYIYIYTYTYIYIDREREREIIHASWSPVTGLWHASCRASLRKWGVFFAEIRNHNNKYKTLNSYMYINIINITCHNMNIGGRSGYSKWELRRPKSCPRVHKSQVDTQDISQKDDALVRRNPVSPHFKVYAMTGMKTTINIARRAGHAAFRACLHRPSTRSATTRQAYSKHFDVRYQSCPTRPNLFKPCPFCCRPALFSSLSHLAVVLVGVAHEVHGPANIIWHSISWRIIV